MKDITKSWLERLVAINRDLKNSQDEGVKYQRVNQLIGYIESLEHLNLDDL